MTQHGKLAIFINGWEFNTERPFSELPDKSEMLACDTWENNEEGVKKVNECQTSILDNFRKHKPEIFLFVSMSYLEAVVFLCDMHAFYITASLPQRIRVTLPLPASLQGVHSLALHQGYLTSTCITFHPPYLYGHLQVHVDDQTRLSCVDLWISNHGLRVASCLENHIPLRLIVESTPYWFPKRF